MADSNKAVWIGCCTFCTALIITGIVLFAISFKGLEATEFGIKYNAYTKKIDESKLYDQGTYFLGPSTRFIKFPLEVKALTYNKDFYIRTKDGMRIEVSVSIQYKLNKRPDVTLQLLKNWGENNFEGVIERFAKDSIRATGSDFNVDSYVYNRKDVDAKMKTELTTELDNLGVSIENFQLTDVVFPNEFRNIILDTQQQAIEVQNVVNEQARAIQEATGRLSKAPNDAANLLQNKKSQTVSRMAKYIQMADAYSTQVPKYTDILVSKSAVYGTADALWANEYMELLTFLIQKYPDWNIKDPIPTPKTLQDIMNMPAQ